MDAVRKLMILNNGSGGGPTWLALQNPSKFKIQDEYSKNGDQRLYLVFSVWTSFILWEVKWI